MNNVNYELIQHATTQNETKTNQCIRIRVNHFYEQEKSNKRRQKKENILGNLKNDDVTYFII